MPVLGSTPQRFHTAIRSRSSDVSVAAFFISLCVFSSRSAPAPLLQKPSFVLPSSSDELWQYGRQCRWGPCAGALQLSRALQFPQMAFPLRLKARLAIPRSLAARKTRHHAGSPLHCPIRVRTPHLHCRGSGHPTSVLISRAYKPTARLRERGLTLEAEARPCWYALAHVSLTSQ